MVAADLQVSNLSLEEFSDNNKSSAVLQLTWHMHITAMQSFINALQGSLPDP